MTKYSNLLAPAAAGLEFPRMVSEYLQFLSDEDLARWTVTAITGGTAAVIDTLAGGAMQITSTDATTNKGANCQYDAGHVVPAAGHELHFKAKVRASDVVASSLYMGLFLLDTDIKGGVTSGVGFRKVSGDAKVMPTRYNAAVPSDYTTNFNPTMVNNEWVELNMYVHFLTSTTARVRSYFNGLELSDQTAVLTTGSVWYPTIEFRSEAAAITTLQVQAWGHEYVFNPFTG